MEPAPATKWTRYNLRACTFTLIRTRIRSTNALNKVDRPREVMAVKVNRRRTFILCRWPNTLQAVVQPQRQMQQVLHRTPITCRLRIFSRWAKAKKFIQVARLATWRIERASRSQWSTLPQKSCNRWTLSAIFPPIKWFNNLCPVKIHKATTLANFRYNRRAVATSCPRVSNNSIILLNSRSRRITEVKVRRQTKPNKTNKNGETAQYSPPHNRRTRHKLQATSPRPRRAIRTSCLRWVRFRTYYRVHQVLMAEEVPQGRPAHRSPVKKAKAPWRQMEAKSWSISEQAYKISNEFTKIYIF